MLFVAYIQLHPLDPNVYSSLDTSNCCILCLTALDSVGWFVLGSNHIAHLLFDLPYVAQMSYPYCFADIIVSTY